MYQNAEYYEYTLKKACKTQISLGIWVFVTWIIQTLHNLFMYGCVYV